MVLGDIPDGTLGDEHARPVEKGRHEGTVRADHPPCLRGTLDDVDGALGCSAGCFDVVFDERRDAVDERVLETFPNILTDSLDAQAALAFLLVEWVVYNRRVGY